MTLSSLAARVRGFVMPAAAGVALAFSGGTASAQCVKTTNNSNLQCFTLYAGQTIDAGSVCVTVENNTLKVTYTTTNGWELTEAHLWIGQSITDMPQTKSGNPIPGQFPFKSGDITGLTSYQFAIPLTNSLISFSCPGPDVTYFLAAHAAVRKHLGGDQYQTETGWSDGSPITSRGNWATFSTFTLTCSCGGGGGGVPSCETAFGKGGSSTCFLDLDASFQRWGWTNGPLGPGSYTFDLWAGGAQCDVPAKGTLIGTVTVNYDGATVTVTYNTTAGWYMLETHLYVGSASLPTMKQGKNWVPTVAPGQYPYSHEGLANVTTDTYTVNASGPIYVIAHASTCINR